MKVSIYVLHLGFGGIEKYAITVANLLAENHEVELISTYKMVDVPAFAVDKKIEIRYLVPNMKPNAKKLKEAIRTRKMVVAMQEACYAIQLLYYKRKININAIKNCTSDVIISTRDYHNALIQKYAKQDVVKVTSEHNHHNNNQKYIKRVVNSCDKFDYMLPISKELTIFYREQLKNVEVRYIPFCIEKAVVQRVEHICPVFINVGRLSPEKGSLELIEVFAEICEYLPKAHLHVVGDGELKDAMKQRILELGIQDYVTMHGFLYKEKIDKLYSESDMFLMTSLTESFGFVLLEAMANGVVCIAYDSAQGANEILTSGVDGFLISNRNRHQYVNQVIQFLSQKKEREYFIGNAKNKVAAYDISATRNGWNQLMQEIEKAKESKGRV